MYSPAHFRVSDPALLHRFLEEHPFGLLVTQGSGEPRVSHLPFVTRVEDDQLTLLGHVARANPQASEGDGPALAIFSGPHHYVSPTWYDAPGTVPTWNYVAVHARGRLSWRDEPEFAREVLESLVAESEAGLEPPWQVDFEEPKTAGMLGGIAAFELRVEHLDGKWKLNQNHPPEHRAGVIDALDKIGSEDARAIVRLMREGLGRRDS